MMERRLGDESELEIDRERRKLPDANSWSEIIFHEAGKHVGNFIESL